MAVPYTFASATSAIPLSQLDSNFSTPITIGNTSVQLGNTVTTLNNMTLGNVTISSVASTFPNNYLANSTATLGNSTITLGGTTSSVGNLTLVNATISSGTYSVTDATVSGNLTLSGGTANGVAYLNGSKVLTTGSALSFNGTTLTLANDASVNGLTVGRGAGAVSTNTAVGASALAAGTASSNNTTAIGYNALLVATAGSNLAVGSNALVANITGDDNTAIGSYAALAANTTGTKNIAVGRQALASNTTASNNTAVGYQAGYSNQTGNYTTYLGNKAGYTATGGYNTFVGDSAGQNATTGTYNTFVGASGCGALVTSGAKNTILGGYNGNQGGLDIRTADNYIVLSDGDGSPRMYVDNSASTNLYLNSPTGSAYAGVLNFTINSSVSSQIYYTTSNSRLLVVNGSAGVYLASGGTSWTSNSDERLKDIIEPISDAANKVSTLRAVIGKFKTDEEGTRRSFLIAQDVQTVLPEAVSVDTDEQGTLGIAYTEVIPLLVAAIKELKSELDAYKATHP